MFSNSSFKAIVLSTCLSLLSACGIKTGEKNITPAPVKVKSAQCLNQAVSDLKVFFKGNALDLQVDSSLSCLEEVFVAFKDNIRGQAKNAYTSREIATFIEINFLSEGDSKFSDDFLKELMFFKVALFGGDNSVITKSEIDLIANFVGRYKSDIIALNPYMKILTLNWNNNAFILEDSIKEKQFLAAKEQFQKLITKITNEFADGNRVYEIDHLLLFVTEVLKFAKSEQSTLDTVQKAGPFLKKFKFYLIGGEASLQGEEWKKLGQTLHVAFFQALRFEYFLKDLDQNQTEKKWVIYEKIALDVTSLIENLLQTKKTQSLSNHEIAEILKPLAQFIPKVGYLSEEVLNELGDIKVVFLGDSPVGRQGWGVRDLEVLKTKIPELFKNVGVLMDSIEYLKPQKDSQFRSRVTYTEFQEIEAKVLVAVRNISRLVERSYDLESLKKLIMNLEKGVLRGYFELPKNFESLYQAALSVKTLLTGEEGSKVSPTNLQLLLNVGTRAYLNYLEYDLFIAQYEFTSVEFISGLERLWPKIKTTISTELELRSENVIKTPYWVNLILVLQNEKFIDTHFGAESLSQAFDALWSHLLNRPEDRLQAIFRPGFDQVAFDQMNSEVETALGLQRHIAQIFSTSSTWKRDLIILEFQNHINQDIPPAQKKGLTDLNGFLLETIPLNHDMQGLLKILDKTAADYHQYDLTISNLARLISRLLIRSYATDPQRIADFSAVTQDEVQKAYDQLKLLAVDLGVVDPSNINFIKSRFLEANLFLSVSDGDQLASFAELHHLILHIFSGISRAGELKKDITAHCVEADPSGQKIIQSNTRVTEECLLQQYLSNEAGFAGLPQFLQLRTDNSEHPEVIRDYAMSLLKAAGHVPRDDKTVLMSDADLFPHVVQYIEMVYARHDTNQDNFLQKEEALAAFPIFKNLLAELVKDYKQIKPEDLPGVFIYILKYGRPPNPKSIGEVLKFVAFIKDKDQKNWAIESTRFDLGKILNYIADAMLNSPQTPTPKPPVATPAAASPELRSWFWDLNLKLKI